MSIADGQVVLQRESGSGRVTVDPQASVSRIGSRAYPPALADLAVQLRFELAQVLPSFVQAPNTLATVEVLSAESCMVVMACKVPELECGTLG